MHCIKQGQSKVRWLFSVKLTHPCSEGLQADGTAQLFLSEWVSEGVRNRLGLGLSGGGGGHGEGVQLSEV